MKTALSRRHPTGFTLIELLTVIAIIGVLVAILIPVAGSVRRNAQQTQSLANLRQIGGAVLLFVGENRGELPVWNNGYKTTPEFNGSGNLPAHYWWESLETYLGDDREIFHSPGDQYFDKSSRARMRETVSYGWNFTVVGRHKGELKDNGEPKPDFVIKLTEVPNPARTLCVAEGRVGGVSWGFIRSEELPDLERYDGRVPALFVDGHVAALSSKDFAQKDPLFTVIKVGLD